MTPERRQRVTGIVRAALGRETAARDAFLGDACGADHALRAEVEELLAAYQEGDTLDEAGLVSESGTLSEARVGRGPAIAAGTRLGPYEVLALVGSGGMGEVYRARHPKLGREVALKILPPDFASDADRLRRFEREARSASSLNHPNIVTIHDVAEQDGTHYIAMELVEGETLRHRLAKGPLERVEVLRIGDQIAQGLAKAHAAGIVHRDLKPANLMITEDGLVKILDFGLAKLVPETPSGPELSTVEGTARGVIMGTVPYMSPEQATGRSVDHRSDQFALGSILLEMATGHRAFRRSSPAQTLAAIIEDDPEGLKDLRARFPASFARIVERCLAKDPGQRFEATRDLAEALRAIPETSSAPPPGLRRGWRLGAALLILLTALLLGRGRVSKWLGPALSTPTIESIAVLPLENLSGNPEQQFLVDGMTESLITDLARLGRLKVIARSSAMRYRATQKPLAEVARELGVDAILEGSAQRDGERVRVMAQLVDPRSGRALWAQRYERAAKDLFDLQVEIARAVAREVGAAATPAEQEARSAPAVSPASHEAYLKGRFHYYMLTPTDLDRALELFESALDKDAKNARAYVGVADVWFARTTFFGVPPETTMPRAREAASRAIALDDRLGEAHRILAKLHVNDWDLEAGEKELQRALALNPNDAESRLILAHLLDVTRRAPQARAEIDKALALDPLDFLTWGMAGMSSLFERNYDQAITRFREALRIEPRFMMPHSGLWEIYFAKGMYVEAADELRLLLAAKGVSVSVPPVRGEADYRRIIKTLAESLASQPGSPIEVARAFTQAGENGLAIDWLEKAYAQHNVNLVYMGIVPALDPLRNEPRFQALMRRLNLPT